MKKINDENIVNLVKNDMNYNIKTTSQSILNQFEYETKLDEQRKAAAKHKRKVIFGSVFGGLALTGALAIGAFFLLTKNSKNTGTSNITVINPDPTQNVLLKSQLIAFSAFEPTEKLSDSTMNLMRLNKNILSEEDEPINNDELIKAAKLYDEVQLSVSNLYHRDNIQLSDPKEVNETINSITYKYLIEFKYIETSEPYAYYYFNDSEDEKDEDEIESSTEAFYISNGNRYLVKIEKETETDSEETETETEIVLTNEATNQVFKVKEEAEISGSESENSLSITTYESVEKFNEDEFLRKVKTETEVDGDESEMIVSVKEKDLKAVYEIDKISETYYKLLTEYSSGDVTFEDIIIELVYENTNRIYSYNGSEILRK